MTTTCVRNSIVGDAWIQQTAANVPIQRILDENGAPTGDILTGPVRLAFDTLFELPAPSADVQNPKYGATLLFTPYADFTVMYEEYHAVCAREFAEYYDATSGQYYGLHSPFRDQGEKMKFGGFTPGCVFINATSKYKPPVIDANHNPIVDPAKAYPGVWAICSVNAYAFKDPRKKGVSFGLQSVMLIGDDEKFGGAAPDPKKTFAQIQGAIQRPAIQPGHVQMPQGAQAPANPTMPPPPLGGTLAAPGGYAAPTSAPAPASPPAGAVSSAPPVSAPVMPGTPAPQADPRGPVPTGFGSWAEYDELMG